MYTYKESEKENSELRFCTLLHYVVCRNQINLVKYNILYNHLLPVYKVTYYTSHSIFSLALFGLSLSYSYQFTV